MLLMPAIGRDGAFSSPPALGGPLLFGRLWEKIGIADVLGEVLRTAASSSPSSAPCSRHLAPAVRLGIGSRLRLLAADYDIPEPMASASTILPRHGLARRRAGRAARGCAAPRCVKDVMGLRSARSVASLRRFDPACLAGAPLRPLRGPPRLAAGGVARRPSPGAGSARPGRAGAAAPRSPRVAVAARVSRASPLGRARGWARAPARPGPRAPCAASGAARALGRRRASSPPAAGASRPLGRARRARASPAPPLRPAAPPGAALAGAPRSARPAPPPARSASRRRRARRPRLPPLRPASLSHPSRRPGSPSPGGPRPARARRAARRGPGRARARWVRLGSFSAGNRSIAHRR